MEATNITKDKITIAFSPEELTFLSNVVNEALDAVEDWEFQARTGETRTRAPEIHAQLGELLDKTKRVGSRHPLKQ